MSFFESVGFLPQGGAAGSGVIRLPELKQILVRGEAMSYRDKLLNLVKEMALEYGEFRLSSGKRSSYYLDGKKITLHPEGSYYVAKAILDIIKDDQAKAIGGLTMGADPIVGAVALLSYIEKQPVLPFIVRKEPKMHGKQKLIEGTLEEGWRVVIVDDVITTGGSTFKAIRAVEELGCKIVNVVCLVDRKEGGSDKIKEEGYKFSPIFTIEELGVEQDG